MSKERVVVVHRGARDGYETAAALAEAGLLEKLVTDLYWPGENFWTGRLPAALRNAGRRRSHDLLPLKLVHQAAFSGLSSFLLEKAAGVPFTWRRAAVRATDARLGQTAGRLAAHSHSLLLSYSYYGWSAFQAYGFPAALFQLHPHPLTVRRILAEERQAHPEYAASLNQEWELALPLQDFERLVEEPRLARWFLAASSFTKKTLIENGTDEEAIRVIPYGVDLERFRPDRQEKSLRGPLRLLFVGTVGQRKGIGYLLEALRRLEGTSIELTICGRLTQSIPGLRELGDRVTVREFVSAAELEDAYRAADLFVLPSLAEGFGHVLLEALASGLPVLTTSHTAGPDLIEEGAQGFVVEPRRADLLAERIEWALGHRTELARMKGAARARAEQFPWRRFRQQIVVAAREWLAADQAEATERGMGSAE